MRMIRYRRHENPNGWLYSFSVPPSDIRVLAHDGFVEVYHGASDDEHVWRIVTGLTRAHAEAVADDLARWLCWPLLSEAPVHFTTWQDYTTYNTEEAVERLRGGTDAE